MPIQSGYYFIKNRETKWWIAPDEGTTSGTPVKTVNYGDNVPATARINVQHDSSDDSYTFRSDSDLYIHDSGKTEGGHRLLIWKNGSFRWNLNQGSPGLYLWKVPGEKLFATDNFTDGHGNRVILKDNSGSSASSWQFVAAN